MHTTGDDKTEIARQWDTDPCGAVTADEGEIESADWYRSVRRSRYEDYAPWMRQVMHFEDWEGRDVLEIGVGLGSDHVSFALAGARMHALDLSREHLRHTAKHLAYHGLTTSGTLGDAECSPYSANRFDLVYSFGALHHTPGTGEAIAEVLRVLRPGGTALIGLYHRWSWFFVLSTVLWNGIVKLGIFRKGWRRLLSEIEYRSAENEALPLVKVFSRRAARRLMHGFIDVRVTTHHVEASHFSRISPLFAGITRDALERLLGWGGWYIVMRARKPAVRSQRQR